MLEDQHYYRQRILKRTIRGLARLSKLQFMVFFVAMAVLISVLIVLTIDFLWDGQFNLELEFAGLMTPFLDAMLLGFLITAILDELREQIEGRRLAAAAIEASELKLKALFDTVNDAIIIIDPSGRILEVNNVTCERLGYLRDELLKMTPHDFDTPEYAARVPERLAEVRRKGTAVFETAWLTHDGRIIPTEISARSIEYDGEPAILSSARDITQRKQAEEALKFLTLRHTAILAAVPDIIMEVDSNKVYVWANKAGYEYFGDDVLGREAAFYFEGEQQTYDIVHPLFNGSEEIIYVESWQRRKDGEKRLLAWWCRMLKDAEGNVIGALSTARDITERKQMGAERETLLRWREDVNLLQRSLLAPSAQDQKLKSITDGIVRIFEADFCRIWLIRPGDLCEQGCVHAEALEGPHVCRYRDRCLHLLASSGRYTHIDGKVHRRVPFGCYKIGRIASGEEHRFLTNDAQNDPRVHNREWARDLGLVSFAGYQLRVPSGQTIGVLALFAKHPISADEDAMLDGLSSTAALVIQQAATEDELKKSEEFNRSILETVDEGFIVIDPEYKIISANKAYLNMINRTEEDVRGEYCYKLSHRLCRPCCEAGENCAVSVTLKTGTPQTAAHTHHDEAGHPVFVEIKSFPVKDDSGKVVAAIEVINNITERKKLEDQLRHAQKMEAVGTLAGGVAHDFNNILNVIIGYGVMLLDRLGDDPLSKEQLNEVLAAADRAATLTKRLLAFSRKQVVDMKPVNLKEILLGIEKMLSRIIGEDIAFTMELASIKMIVLADSGQIEQVLMNLASNARDAMPKGGRLAISTGSKEMDDAYITAYGYGKAGTYALISVADTGSGMDAETRKNIFEPFFTTKGVGEGTGLGLSIVYGIIKQHNGYINVYSEPGKGTEFKIYLPLIEEEVAKVQEVEAVVPIKGGTETILLAEDDASLRKLSRIVLESFGYTVITAEDGEDAITKYMENREKIQLVILDMIMPKKNGKEAYAEIKKIWPGIKALFVSGYTMDIINKKELLDEGMDFILKPVSPRDLVKKVREALDR